MWGVSVFPNPLECMCQVYWMSEKVGISIGVNFKGFQIRKMSQGLEEEKIQKAGRLLRYNRNKITS